MLLQAYTSTANIKQKHSGSTLLAIDVDDDNDKDLILGDISYNNLVALMQGHLLFHPFQFWRKRFVNYRYFAQKQKRERKI